MVNRESSEAKDASNHSPLPRKSISPRPKKNIIPSHSRPNRTKVDSTCFYVMITGQIESATFPSGINNLYCRYSFTYGPDWDILHGVNSGITQIAKRNIDGNNNKSIAWNFPIEIAFKSTNAFGWPRIALAIYGIDSLGRDVVRGYGSLMCPTCPGRYERIVQTYRPVSGSICQRIMNWIGGTPPEFYDSKFVTQSEGRGVVRVHTEGTVKVILNVITKEMESFGYTC
mmetsp:Transcript_19756/g.28988  ORF Transcript_19756/g.28988 Transcript_19756/m.28988 type:complete len:228 (-) Transcript_19756:170-853(-)